MLADRQYLFIDLIIVDIVALTATRLFSNEPVHSVNQRTGYFQPRPYTLYHVCHKLHFRNEAYKKLSPKAPPQRVIHLPMLASLILQILLMTVVQTLMYEWTINQEWFCSISDNFPDCFERNDEGGILRALNVTERCPRDGTCISEVPHIDFTCDDKGLFQTFFWQN